MNEGSRVQSSHILGSIIKQGVVGLHAKPDSRHEVLGVGDLTGAWCCEWLFFLQRGQMMKYNLWEVTALFN